MAAQIHKERSAAERRVLGGAVGLHPAIRCSAGLTARWFIFVDPRCQHPERGALVVGISGSKSGLGIGQSVPRPPDTGATTVSLQVFQGLEKSRA
jgi:hypothetical protein